ncbi:ankyrin repeat domain-containing protein 33B [Astyanax mexicanus]|uniref:Ankyrin repeat domain-containing protein 33B n=1 Tax=Astyanax mexicanus TaxID=7994 RepID=A0A8T2MH81_ASTMX|nr:ankyrin repeat domain-containing protein 33B [Astyanax mexicanus]
MAKAQLLSRAGAASARVQPTIHEESTNTTDDDYDSYVSSCGSEDAGNEEYEEYDDFSDPPDTRSIASDDSFYPPEYFDDDFEHFEESEISSHDVEGVQDTSTLSFFQACSSNQVLIVKFLIRRGVKKEEVQETDKNNRTGLLVACYQGYMDVVMALTVCPHLDVNWQDKEGNTALITAAQAGHITITNYLLNYFPGLDIEKRNCHGFTALMKAAMQGRVDCVRALMMAGADLEARDHGRNFTPREWAVFTGRYELAFIMLRLIQRPCPEQCSDAYRPEWPLLPALVSKAQQPKGCIQKISEAIRDIFDISNVTEASEDGVLDHMVRMTTGLGSPFIALTCRTVCPSSPPCVGKRRYSVQEIMTKHRAQNLKGLGPGHLDTYNRLFQNARVLLVPKPKDRRSSLQPQNYKDSLDPSVVDPRRASLMPLHMVRRSSVRPGLVVPKLRITKAPPPTYEPEKDPRKNSNTSGQFLQIPKWRYKELKEERKKAEEAEKKKQEAITKKKVSKRKQK